MADRGRSRWWMAVGGLWLVGCGPSAGGQGETTGTGGSSGARPGSEASTQPLDAGASSVASASTDDGTTSGSASTTSGSSEDTGRSESSSTGERCAPKELVCGDLVLACGNGLDEDGDGLVDLADPECTTACDDDEGSFTTGLPDDNQRCKIDCLFDGNTGQGDDTCLHDLGCDPLEPVPVCGPFAEANCGNVPQPGRGCVAFCEPFVPNGCDCFGCCTFDTPEGPKNVFLEWEECTLADGLAGCHECTQQIELCGNPCDVQACEVCIGQVAPAEGCAAPACVGGTACTSTCDCPPGEGCITGCCMPPPAA